MGTSDVRLDPQLNKKVWESGIKGVPFRLRVLFNAITIKIPEINPAIGSVKTHPLKINNACLQFTAPPVRHCVVLTGNPNLDANNTVMAAPSSILNPLVGDNCVILFPNDRMI